MFNKKLEKFLSKITAVKPTGTIASFILRVDEKKIDSKLHHLDNAKTNYFFLSKKSRGCKLLGWNPLITISYNGPNRISKSESEIRKLSANFISNWSEFKQNSFPLFVGGIKFNPDQKDSIWNNFNDSEWYIPEFSLYETNDETFFIYNFYIKENHDQILSSFSEEYKNLKETESITLGPDHIDGIKKEADKNDFDSWSSNVNEALKIISNQDAEKIVLSRQVRYELQNEVNVYSLMEKLYSSYPECHAFAYRKGNSVFFGASPERLASISDGWVIADALAGSAARGTSPEDDQKLAASLLSSEKNINEQRAVVDFIAQSFGEFTGELEYPEKPQIKKLPNIQHLWTPIKAKLKEDKTVFELLKEIHPTPAICGVPWSKALSFIHETEAHNRGLYAGIIGWFNFNNEAEFIVGLRSGLIKENTLYAFAGCGIVKGSDPVTEYHESELKLKPILSLFKNEETG